MGRPAALLVSCGGQLAALALLSGTLGSATFMVAVCAFNFFWNFVLPYQYAALIDVERSGRLVVLVTAFQAAGLAAGPSLPDCGSSTR